MARKEHTNGIMTKTEKIKELMSLKREDVEFSALAADKDDVEALVRSEEADTRQLRKMESK
ncbi:hypothetical protein J2T13_000541 [Paenibacillus sp. DS2015]|uniref:YfhD family protein n=1 Tax=Paenibacillus sp. DS2015 TaxID=3373917 RepID=UPI003D225FC3